MEIICLGKCLKAICRLSCVEKKLLTSCMQARSYDWPLIANACVLPMMSHVVLQDFPYLKKLSVLKTWIMLEVACLHYLAK